MLGCQLAIHTDSKGIIRSIRAGQDTIGMWEWSRCAEVLR